MLQVTLCNIIVTLHNVISPDVCSRPYLWWFRDPSSV